MKYPEDFVNKIICGDALELIKHIPDEVIDIVITDPPYGLGKNIIGDKDLSLFHKILPECYRVLKDDSFFITFFSIKLLPQVFVNNPFQYFWQVILHCSEGAVQSPVGFTKYMSCFVFKKGNPKVKKLNKDIFMDSPGKLVEPDEGFIEHPTVKPKKFIMELLGMFSQKDDIVLDPFIGSGSTALACLYTDRKYIGFEIEPKFCKLAEDRIKRYLSQLKIEWK